MTTFVNNDVQSGNIIYAADHNEQGARVAAVLNGGIDSGNIAAKGASLANINGGATAGVLIADASGNVTVQPEWASWTPTLTNFTGTVNKARYKLVGKICHFYIEITQGASVSGRHIFSLPVPASSNITTTVGWGAPISRGSINYYGVDAYEAFGSLISTTTCGLGYNTVSGTKVGQAPSSATSPMTWRNGQDTFWLTGSYEVA